MILRETPGAFQTTILTLRTGHLFFVWQKDLFIVFHCGWKKIVRESVERVDACNCGAQETHQRLDFRAGGEEIAFKVPIVVSDTLVFYLNEYSIELNRAKLKKLNQFLN